uniref:Zn(2)-C6 fungal-type domain-containing protein n=1 Tax=Bionectria ochroleuca TaxID=29856 RepID=A0A0B7KM60_BIOOC
MGRHSGISPQSSGRQPMPFPQQTMAPSTTTPSNLHRASIACLNCRGAKVRCLSLRGAHRCNRCVTNDIECFFERPKRSRAKTRQALQPMCASRRTSITLQDHDRRVITVSEQVAPLRPSSSPPLSSNM